MFTDIDDLFVEVKKLVEDNSSTFDEGVEMAKTFRVKYLLLKEFDISFEQYVGLYLEICPDTDQHHTPFFSGFKTELKRLAKL